MKVVIELASRVKDMEGSGRVPQRGPLSQHSSFSLLPPIWAYGYTISLDPSSSLLSVFAQVFHVHPSPIGSGKDQSI